MKKRLKNGTIIFSDYPEFKPNKTPKEMFKEGVFGGTYYRPIFSNVTKKNYKNPHTDLPKSWFKNVVVTSLTCNKELNKYKVTSGTSLRYWESKGWIHEQDPYGWVQWYCRFYLGRRTEDDIRQIKRWLGVVSRFGNRISPVIKQLLLQWGYEKN